MRRISALVLLSLLAMTLAAPVSAATTIPVSAFVKENFERAPSDEPCVFVEEPFSVTCFGSGNAGRFGPITSVVVFTDDAITRTITLRDGSTVTLDEVYRTDDAGQLGECARCGPFVRPPGLRDRHLGGG